MPAARMIGVASRNANRAESLWSRPRARPAPIVTPSRLMPATSAVDWATPTTNASRYSSVSSSRAAVGLCALADRQFAHLRAAAEALGAEQHEAVDHQEDRRHFRLGGQRAQLVLEHEADYARRDARDDDQPGEALGRRSRPAACASVRKNARTISTQSRQK